MRNYFLMMMLFVGAIFSLTSCEDDDPTDPIIGEPTISVTLESVEKAPGGTVEFEVTAEAASGAAVASVTANDNPVAGGT